MKQLVKYSNKEETVPLEELQHWLQSQWAVYIEAIVTAKHQVNMKNVVWECEQEQSCYMQELHLPDANGAGMRGHPRIVRRRENSLWEQKTCYSEWLHCVRTNFGQDEKEKETIMTCTMGNTLVALVVTWRRKVTYVLEPRRERMRNSTSLLTARIT